MDDALRIREFWFGKSLTGIGPEPGQLASQARVLKLRMGIWFPDDPRARQRHDELIRSQFASVLERALQGRLTSWADSPRRRLSLIILLDQFPRQMFRGSARAFEYDSQALALTLSGMQSAADAALNLAERLFFYMPLQHAESAEVQDESASAYRRLVTESPPELRSFFEEAFEAAQQHRDLIRQFGRFPHRNEALGRSDTPEEAAYLKAHPNQFG